MKRYVCHVQLPLFTLLDPLRFIFRKDDEISECVSFLHSYAKPFTKK